MWTPDDLANYGDEALEELRIAVLTEQERRQRLADVPAQIAEQARRYVEDGGDPAALQEAIDVSDA